MCTRRSENGKQKGTVVWRLATISAGKRDVGQLPEPPATMSNVSRWILAWSWATLKQPLIPTSARVVWYFTDFGTFVRIEY